MDQPSGVAVVFGLDTKVQAVLGEVRRAERGSERQKWLRAAIGGKF